MPPKTTNLLPLTNSFRTGHKHSWANPPYPENKTQLDDFAETLKTYRNISLYPSVLRKPNIPTRRTAHESEEFHVGDTVLVRHNGTYPSVAVVVALWAGDIAEEEEDSEPEDEGPSEPMARVHWFVLPSQLPKNRPDRSNLNNEVYYTLSSTADIPVADILAKCVITTSTGLRSVDSTTSDRITLYCVNAVNEAGSFFYVFNWDRHRAAALKASHGDISAWRPEALEISIDETPQKAKPSTTERVPPNKRRRLHRDEEEDDDDEESGSDDDDAFQQDGEDEEEEEEVEEDQVSSEEEEEDESEDDRENPRTPKKRKRRTNQSQPRTPRAKRHGGTAVTATPHSKAGFRARQKLFARRLRPELSNTAPEDLSHLPKDKFLRAMHVLHVGSRPDTLPCRDDQYADILGKVFQLVEEGTGGCVYVSGVPGTGKTATVHAVVRDLREMAARNETSPFTYVEINGLKIPEPTAAYALLWEALSGHDVESEGHLKLTAKEALRNLDRYFSGSGGRGPGGGACVVLMDELDQMLTTKQDVVYNFFNWPSLARSKLVVVAVANTMDLPERVMTGKVRSRLGMARVDFRPYIRDQLNDIVNARLKTATDGLALPIKDIMAPDAIQFASAKVASISGDARRVLDICRRAVEIVHALPSPRPVTVADVMKVIQDMQNSPTAAYLRLCSFHEKVMLVAMWKCAKKDGVEVVKWTDLWNQHLGLLGILADHRDQERRPLMTELALILDSLLASRALLIEEKRRGFSDGDRKVMLNLEEGEVLRVLGETSPKWKSALGA